MYNVGAQRLPGTYSGLHLLAITYAAFKHIDPGMGTGDDSSAEHAAAQELSSK